MKNTLVINSGSLSLKYKVINEREEIVQRGCLCGVSDYTQAIKSIFSEIKNLADIKFVGHRFVHGGDSFFRPTLLSEKILEELARYNDLAPLHNPYSLMAAKSTLALLPTVPQVAIFDTSFYRDLPQKASLYAIPRNLSDQYKIKRYGFHGLSHQFSLEEAAKSLGKAKKDVNLIICHLGGGWSITAIKKGKPIDTSMGLTPMEGLAMMTRSGDLDAGIIFELLKKIPGKIDEAKVEKIYNILNKESGIKGLTGLCDYKEFLSMVSKNPQAKLAFEVVIYRLVKYIGAYWAALEGKVDAIVFTGAIGSGKPKTREEVIKHLKFLGKVKFLTIPANEELMIARQIKKINS